MTIVSLPSPPLGWNSFDSYGIFINEQQVLENLNVFIEKLKPYGYDYFCIDAGWYSEYEFQFNPNATIDKHSAVNCIDEYGRFIASPRLFPRGLKFIADQCHAHDIKLGIHIMRGVPRISVERNTPIKGTPYCAADIANTDDICIWNTFLYGVNMDKPGAQEYYDSVVEYLAENGIDFIKADDITDFPREVEAVSKAIAKVERPIALSLSPGGSSSVTNYAHFAKCANMIRITSDVWDRPEDLVKSFDRWELWQDYTSPTCYLDLDMIPFGALQVYAKEASSMDENLAGVGSRRMCNLSEDGKKTFITQRALASSPLIMGGSLPLTPKSDFAYLTNPHMLECNQSGICAKKIYFKEYIDIRKKETAPGQGWIGVFNRWNHSKAGRPYTLTVEDLGFTAKTAPKQFYDVWHNTSIDFTSGVMVGTLPPQGCLLLQYS